MNFQRGGKCPQARRVLHWLHHCFPISVLFVNRTTEYGCILQWQAIEVYMVYVHYSFMPPKQKTCLKNEVIRATGWACSRVSIGASNCHVVTSGVVHKHAFCLIRTLRPYRFFPSSSLYLASTSKTQNPFPTNGFGSHNLQFNSLRIISATRNTVWDILAWHHLLSQCCLMIFIYVFLVRRRFDYPKKLIGHEQIIG